jgi:hypothetical protein
MSALEESCQEVVIAWTPSVVFIFIVLLRDWLYRRRRGSTTDRQGHGPSRSR